MMGLPREQATYKGSQSYLILVSSLLHHRMLSTSGEHRGDPDFLLIDNGNGSRSCGRHACRWESGIDGNGYQGGGLRIEQSGLSQNI